MRVLFSTTGTGIGESHEERRKKLEEMVNTLTEKVAGSFRPDKILLFYTDETTEMVEVIKLKMGKEVVKEIKLKNPDDFNSCFEIMFSVMREYARKELLVNYTFGTKTMSAAMASCGILFDAHFVVIGGERRTGVISGPPSVILTEPYKIKDRLTLEKIAAFFNNYNFSAAISEANGLKALEGRENLVEFISAYREWDLFRHEVAFEKLKNSWKSINFVDRDQVKENIEFLGRLVALKEKEVELHKKKLLDLMENAKRRIEIGLYDDAVARLYRATELISQILLKKEDYDDPIVLIRDYSLIEKYEQFAEESGGTIRLKLGLIKKLEFLSDLGVDTAKDMLEDKKLRGLIDIRNQSILAHGLRAVRESDAKNFYGHLLNYVREIYGKYYEEDSKKCRFPKMKAT